MRYKPLIGFSQIKEVESNFDDEKGPYIKIVFDRYDTGIGVFNQFCKMLMHSRDTLDALGILLKRRKAYEAISDEHRQLIASEVYARAGGDICD